MTRSKGQFACFRKDSGVNLPEGFPGAKTSLFTREQDIV